MYQLVLSLNSGNGLSLHNNEQELNDNRSDLNLQIGELSPIIPAYAEAGAQGGCAARHLGTDPGSESCSIAKAGPQTRRR